MVVDVEVAGEAGPGVPGLVPTAVRKLRLHEELDAAAQRVALLTYLRARVADAPPWPDLTARVRDFAEGVAMITLNVNGTGAAVPALVAAGIGAKHPAIRRAVDWLERAQNDDGGWGEDLRSYDDQALGGRGESTASQTAWALLALLAAGERDSAATERGIRWLAQTQREDGSWDEPWYTGTGFPGDFYINYHLYRLAFPVSALGRYVNGGDA